jgi:Fe-S oxidoreductase
MSEAAALGTSSNPVGAEGAGLWGDPELQHCIQCGTCSGICPFGFVMDFPPSRIIAALRAEMLKRVTSTDTVWMCIACSACTSVCPSKIPVTVNLMARAKEELLLAGSIPAELQTALENSQRYGNPMGESPRKRTNWIQGDGVVIPVLGKDIRDVDVLWYVGDYPSYHPRVQPTGRAFARLQHALGVNFAILGNDEGSDGDSQRLAGERGLFEVLAQKNAKAFARYKFRLIVTTDPHAYNAFKNYYPSLDIAYPVQHYTQFLAERIETLKPLLKHELKVKVAFHDPCYLGRVNGIYDEPRLLLSAIPGLTLLELPHNRSTSLCCGGGGGGMWMDGFQWEKAGVRLSEWRVQEALSVRADILAVACPYEKPRFEDATKTVKGAEKLVVKDVSELLAEAME